MEPTAEFACVMKCRQQLHQAQQIIIVYRQTTKLIHYKLKDMLERKDCENYLILRSQAEDSLLSVRTTNTTLKFQIYGLPDQQFQKMNMHELQINNIADTPFLKDYFDTPQSLIQFMKVQNNLNINFSKGCIELLSKHPTKQNQNIKIGQIQLHPKELLDNPSFQQISTSCLSSSELTNQQVKSILLKLTQQLMTLSQKPLRKKEKCLQENQGSNVREGQRQKTKITKSVLEQEVDSVKQMMGRKIGKIMEEVEKSRQIFMSEMQTMKNRFELLEKNNQISKNSFTTQLKKQIQETKSLIANDKNELKPKIQKNASHQQMPYGVLPMMGYMGYPQMMGPPNSNMRGPPNMMGRPSYGMQPNRQQQLTLIQDIEAGEQGMKIKAKVIKCSQKSRNKVSVVLGDHTGVVDAFLNKMEQIKVGNTILLVDCNAEVHKEHIQIQLSRGGKIFEVLKRDQITNVKQSNNISQKSWVEQQEF